jgi:S-adenosylmethionine synthetase
LDVKRNIIIEGLTCLPVAKQKVEIVERKGIGHPDSICDAIMDEISVALSKEYISQIGNVLHHNIDKGLLVAGSAEHRLGGGKVTEPMRLIIGDRATFTAGEIDIPVESIAIETAKKWFRDNLRFVDPEKDVRYEVELKPGSPELVDIFTRQKGLLEANDTSAAVGYAPLTETERLVIAAEQYLNSSAFKNDFPAAGEDVKVMGFRAGKELHLTVAMPLVDRFVDSEKTYFTQKKEILEALQDFTNRKKYELNEVKVYLNTLDQPGRGLGGMYLSVTGTSAEDADSGEVGRGNRVNGVIALNRPVGTEAAAGKNPVSHVGKIYNLLTHHIASAIYNSIQGISEVYVWLCSQIGVTIDKPLIASAQVVLEKGVSLEKISPKVAEIIDFELANIGSFTEELAIGKYRVW